MPLYYSTVESPLSRNNIIIYSGIFDRELASKCDVFLFAHRRRIVKNRRRSGVRGEVSFDFRTSFFFSNIRESYFLSRRRFHSDCVCGVPRRFTIQWSYIIYFVPTRYDMIEGLVFSTHASCRAVFFFSLFYLSNPRISFVYNFRMFLRESFDGKTRIVLTVHVHRR